MTLRRAPRIWESNEDPGSLRFVVRHAKDNSGAIEEGFKRRDKAFDRARDLTSRGFFVEVFDNDYDYGW